MNFNHLEYAVEVSKAGSIRKASQNLYMSQPYLSGMIKALEEELGYRIFNRTAAGVTLTKEGEEFIRSAQVILLELKKIREIDVDKEERELNVSSVYSSLVMSRFLKFHNASNYKFSDKIKEMGSMEVLESVASGNSTIGLLFVASEKQRKYEKLIKKYELHAKELREPFEMYVMFHKSHPLAGIESMNLENLSDYPYVTYNDSGSRSYLEVLGIQDHPELLEVSDRGSFYDSLRSGEYLTTMAFSKRPADGEFLTVPFQDRHMTLLLWYVIAKNYKLSEREKAFLAFLKD